MGSRENAYAMCFTIFLRYQNASMTVTSKLKKKQKKKILKSGTFTSKGFETLS